MGDKIQGGRGAADNTNLHFTFRTDMLARPWRRQIKNISNKQIKNRQSEMDERSPQFVLFFWSHFKVKQFGTRPFLAEVDTIIANYNDLQIKRIKKYMCREPSGE